MKLSFTFLALLFTTSLLAQTFCLRLSEVSNDGSNFIVKIEMSGSSTFALGSSNLQWSFNTSKINNPVLESSALPGVPFYDVGVTNPNPGQASLNIDLSFANLGSDIATAWTEIAQVNFTVVDPSDVGELIWLYTGGTTQTIVYLDNESTQIFATAPACLEGLLAPLPVELLSFRAALDGKQVQLDWATASEKNSQGFEVQRSADAQNWKKIDWLSSRGGQDITEYYQSIDAQPLAGQNYYRLKLLDWDGSFDYSPVEEVFVKAPLKVRLYPNPTNDILYFSYPIEQAPEQVMIYNQLGSLQYQSNGVVVEQLDLSTWSEGIYFVEMQFAQELIQAKVLVKR